MKKSIWSWFYCSMYVLVYTFRWSEHYYVSSFVERFYILYFLRWEKWWEKENLLSIKVLVHNKYNNILLIIIRFSYEIFDNFILVVILYIISKRTVKSKVLWKPHNKNTRLKKFSTRFVFQLRRHQPKETLRLKLCLKVYVLRKIPYRNPSSLRPPLWSTRFSINRVGCPSRPHSYRVVSTQRDPVVIPAVSFTTCKLKV